LGFAVNVIVSFDQWRKKIKSEKSKTGERKMKIKLII